MPPKFPPRVDGNAFAGRSRSAEIDLIFELFFEKNEKNNNGSTNDAVGSAAERSTRETEKKRKKTKCPSKNPRVESAYRRPVAYDCVPGARTSTDLRERSTGRVYRSLGTQRRASQYRIPRPVGGLVVFFPVFGSPTDRPTDRRRRRRRRDSPTASSPDREGEKTRTKIKFGKKKIRDVIASLCPPAARFPLRLSPRVDRLRRTARARAISPVACRRCPAYTPHTHWRTGRFEIGEFL